MNYISAVILVLTVISGTGAFPEGPPLSACVDMQPGVRTGVVGLIGHLAQPQNELPTYGNVRTPPYYIQINAPGTEYSPGQEIQVSIKSNQTSGLRMYKGVFMQARRVKCASDIGRDNETILVEDEPLGTFRPLGNNMLLETMECGGIEHSAVSHKSPQFKINETVTWVAPGVHTGHVVFRATIVQEAYIYWMDVHSRILIDPTDPNLLPPKCGACRVEGYTALIMCLLTMLYYYADNW